MESKYTKTSNINISYVQCELNVRQIEITLRLVLEGKLRRHQKKTFRNLQGKVAMQWDMYRSGDKTAEDICPIVWPCDTLSVLSPNSCLSFYSTSIIYIYIYNSYFRLYS